MRDFVGSADGVYRPGPGPANCGRSGLLNAPGGGVHFVGVRRMEAEDLRPDEAGAAYGESRSCGADEELPKAALAAMAAALASRRLGT